MAISDMFEELTQWCVLHNAYARSLQWFHEYFNNYRQEEPEEFCSNFGNAFSYEKLSLEIKKVAYSIMSCCDDSVAISICYNMYYNDEFCGEYRAIFDLDGEAIDDVLKTYRVSDAVPY